MKPEQNDWSFVDEISHAFNHVVFWMVQLADDKSAFQASMY